MFANVKSLGLFGLNAFMVDVEVDISRGAPFFNIGGLPDTAVKESKDRIRSALRACSIEFPVASVTINLAPASTKKSGSVHDIAILVAIVKALGIIKHNIDNFAFIGEVSLNGSIRAVDGVLPMVMKAREDGIKAVFVPLDNAFEASVVDGITIYGVQNSAELIDHLCGYTSMTQQKRYIPPETSYDETLDFADVKGQQFAKRAIEIASAGGHNALLIGSPGSGKSMIAKRIPSILPPLTFEESLETTNIHSISGLIDRKTPLVTKRPFRSPHHTISSAGLAGGGTIPHPGEISLAHNGVLFLDEFAEFDRSAIEILRQPLEDNVVTISRSAGTVTYPCRIMLIGAMNPCPCGYYGHPKRECICSNNKVKAYISKISGPMIDRFDLHIMVAPLEFQDMSSEKKEESSAEIRKRVMEARKIQTERFKGLNINCNAQIDASNRDKFCPMSENAVKTLEKIFDKINFSARAYDKIIKVGRTIADLDNSEIIDVKHILEAVQYRSLDRKNRFDKEKS